MSAPTPALAPHKAAFLSSCVTAGALKFGTFTLKSGRMSPYFFNAGLFHTASLLDSLTAAYAATLASSAVDFDILFGPAYKGIPLAAATAIQLRVLDDARFGGVSYSFNRKEAKDHGEGGSIVGAPLKGKRVVIIDDVITAGTAIREAIEIIKREGGTLVGIVVALDRLEKTPAKEGEQEEAPRESAIGEVRRQYGIPVLSILTLDDVVEFLKGMGTQEDVGRLQEYRAKYRASD
ncbi:orotate phosphoribosyltransferase [Coniosporium apollinis CBS 100218]|uniref:Orotate phosphoribosyltransferase n=1 Tax=Coniosporium apollinis (strain CBS 100218) TaxID=1168221 RepID=R7YW30_CONA1|nr:orotate phosphoribosyltransferase [Coniosporium apollinis CBS 100218]EON66120.1 orotate phosphoribosyltransferase [Coniosporium apollinis CBS 100218]